MAKLVPWAKEEQTVSPAANTKKVPWAKSNTTPAKAGDYIFRQGQVFTGKGYEAGGMTPKNKQTYESVGDPLTIAGVPVSDFRTQKTPEGDQNYFVPKPAVDPNDVVGGRTGVVGFMEKGVMGAVDLADDALDFLGGDEGSSDRIMQGIGLETIRGTVNLGLWLADNVVNNVTMDTMGNNRNIIDDVYEDFNKNFPSMPAGNNVEKMAQEIGTFIVGYAGGRKTISEGPKTLAPATLKFFGDIYAKIAKKKDPVAAAKAVDLLIRSALKESAGNLGGTVVSPEDVGSYSKDLGLTQDDKVGLFYDSQAFSGALATIAKIAGIGVQKIGQLIKTKQMTPQTAAKSIFGLVDEAIADGVNPQELDKRIQILTEVLEKNKQFKFQIENLADQTVNVDTSTGLLLGAQEYFKRVSDEIYGGLVPPEKITAQAQTMARNISDLKKTYYNKPQVSAKDADMVGAFSKTMRNTADAVTGDPKNAAAIRGQTAVTLGNQVVDSLNTPDPNKLGMIAAQEGLESEKKKNRIIQELLAAKKGTNPSTAQYDATLDQVGIDLYNNYITDKQAVETIFNSVPDEPVNAVEFAQAIKNAGDEKLLLDVMGVAPAESKPIRPIGDDTIDQQTGALISPVNNLAKQLEGLTVKDLVRRVRPLLAAAKDQIANPFGGKVNKDVTQYQMLIDYIDGVAENAGPEFQNAMDQYKLFKQKYQSPSLDPFVEAANQVQPIYLSDGTPLTPKGQIKMETASRQALEDSMNSLNRKELEIFLNASRTSTNSKAVTQALVARAINQLAMKGGDITSNELISSLEPILKALEVAGDKETIKAWTDAVELLRMAESGMIDAKQAYDTTLTSANLIRERARESAAFEFVTKTGGAYKPVDPGEANETFRKFFNGPNLPSRIEQLLSEAKAAGNELAINGIKSHFLKWIKERVTTKGNATGVTLGEEGATFTKDFSSNNMNNILTGENGDTTLAAMEKLFANDKQVAQTFIELLKVMSGFVDLRGMRAQAFGSQTAGLTQLQKATNTMITLGFGVLNPTATKLRTISKLFTEDVDASSKYVSEKLIDGMLADIDTFKAALKALADDETGRTAQGLVEKLLRGAAGPLARGTYASTHPTQDEQTQEALPMK